jgi:hypothetical protein
MQWSFVVQPQRQAVELDRMYMIGSHRHGTHAPRCLCRPVQVALLFAVVGRLGLQDLSEWIGAGQPT